MEQDGGKKKVKRKRPAKRSKTRVRPKRVASRREQRRQNRIVDKRRRTLPPPRPQNYGSTMGAKLSDALSLASLFKQPEPKKPKVVPKKELTLEEIATTVGAYKDPLLQLYKDSMERMRRASADEMRKAALLVEEKKEIEAKLKRPDYPLAVIDHMKESIALIDDQIAELLTSANRKDADSLLTTLRKTQQVQDEINAGINDGLAKAVDTEHKIVVGLRTQLNEEQRIREEQAARERMQVTAIQASNAAYEQASALSRDLARQLEAERRTKDQLGQENDRLKQTVTETEQKAQEAETRVQEMEAARKQAEEEKPMTAEQGTQGDQPQQTDQQQQTVNPAADDEKKKIQESLRATLVNITDLPGASTADLGSSDLTMSAPLYSATLPQVPVGRRVGLATEKGLAIYNYVPPTAEAFAAGTPVPMGQDAVMAAPVDPARPAPLPPAVGTAPDPKQPKTPPRSRPRERALASEPRQRAPSLKRPADSNDVYAVARKTRLEQSAPEAELKEDTSDLITQYRGLNDKLKFLLEEWKLEKDRKLKQKMAASIKLLEEQMGALRAEMIASGLDPDSILAGRGQSGEGDGTTDQQLEQKMRPYEHRGFSGVIASDQIKDLKDYTKHGNEMSFIMNLDNHKQPGSHWVPVYIRWGNTKSGGPEVDYADSFGDPPSKSTMSQLKELVKSRGAPYMLKMKINRREEQRENSDTCGGHSMRFLADMYAGKTFKEATGYTKTAAEHLAKKMEGRGGVPRFGYI